MKSLLCTLCTLNLPSTVCHISVKLEKAGGGHQLIPTRGKHTEAE